MSGESSPSSIRNIRLRYGGQIQFASINDQIDEIERRQRPHVLEFDCVPVFRVQLIHPLIEARLLAFLNQKGGAQDHQLDVVVVDFNVLSQGRQDI